MEEIVLQKIGKKNNTISYDFTVSEGLEKYFSGKPFVIEYPEDVEAVPDAIAAIPFVSNVLPIIWLTNSVLRLNELDRAFYECSPNVRGGFEQMFPESTFAGQIQVDRIVECDQPVSGGCAAFFSGGLDAVHTLVRHLDEKPALISIWGSDIRFENVAGWDVVHKGIAEYSEKYNLPDVMIRSSFRDFDNEGLLHKDFYEQLQDGWWHGVKHGIGLLGHAAPYAYLHGLSTVYIASSNCPADGHVRCSSNPLTDNHVRYANARVIHDGFECSRQDKVREVVDYVNRTNDQVSVHVCWESQSGSNCCRCEKCYRTMAALIAEGADPVDYGFSMALETIGEMQVRLIGHGGLSDFLSETQWVHIGKRMKQNKRIVRDMCYWDGVKWVHHADFEHPKTLKVPMTLRERLSQYRFYQKLHELKVKLRG